MRWACKWVAFCLVVTSATATLMDVSTAKRMNRKGVRGEDDGKNLNAVTCVRARRKHDRL